MGVILYVLVRSDNHSKESTLINLKTGEISVH